MADAAWTPAFAYPCEQHAGIFRCLDPGRRATIGPFLEQYRLVRERDGYRGGSGEYYRALPSARADDPQSAVWGIRQRSFRRLVREMRARGFSSQPAVLDLGAGSGWLSHQLARAGCRAVAVDMLADERDGLGACRHYDVPLVCVEADFDALPFVPGQFDVAVFNGSLHYAPDVRTTLARAAGMLRPSGLLIVIDSPMFERDADGLAMRARLRRRLHDEYGVASPIEPGEGFLTFTRMDAAAAAIGRAAAFFPSGDWRSRLRRTIGRRAAGPAAPQFGVWVAA